MRLHTGEAAVAKVAEFRDAAEAQLAALKQECEALVSRFDVAVSQGACFPPALMRFPCHTAAASAPQLAAHDASLPPACA